MKLIKKFYGNYLGWFMMRMNDAYSLEMIGDSLSEQEIVDLLNEQDEEIKELKDRIDKYRDDNERYSFNTGGIKPESPRFKVTSCTTEILDTTNNHYHWLEMEGNVEEICKILNELHEENKELKNDNQRLINKLNTTALELATDYISMGKAVEISEMSYHDFLKYRNDNGKPMELRL